MRTFIYLRTNNIVDYLNQLADLNSMYIKPFSFIVIKEHQEVTNDSSDREEIKLLKSIVNERRISNILIHSIISLFSGKRSLLDFFACCRNSNIKVYSFKEPGLAKLFDLEENIFLKEMNQFLGSITGVKNEPSKISYKPKTGISIIGYPKKN